MSLSALPQAPQVFSGTSFWHTVRDAFIALTAILLTLLLFEIGMLCAGARFQASFFKTDLTLGHAYRQNAKGWWVNENILYTHINSQGHHDREHTLAKTAAIRIAVVGASYVGGMEVPIEKNFPYLLQDVPNFRLGNKRRVEVLNRVRSVLNWPGLLRA